MRLRSACLGLLGGAKGAAATLKRAAFAKEPFVRRSTLSAVLGCAGVRRLHEALSCHDAGERLAAAELLVDLARDESSGQRLLMRQAGFLMHTPDGVSVWVFSVPRKMFLSGSAAHVLEKQVSQGMAHTYA